MDIFKTIKDSDFGINNLPAVAKRERQASRAVVFDNEQNIVLLHVTKKNFHKLPGGGIEPGESIVDALRRETKEEAGCEINNIKELGIVEEFRNKFGLHQISYCFIADLAGEKGQPKLEPDEITDGFTPVWMKLEEAIKILASETDIKDYEGKFIHVRDLTLLEEAKKFIDKNNLIKNYKASSNP